METRVGKIPLTCDYCGKTFMRYAGNVKSTTKLHFCNRECKTNYYKADVESRTCQHCGKEFKVYSSILRDSNASGNYCSRECYWESMKREEVVYKGFSEAKRKYFSKKQVCAVCGTTKNIQIHHIIPNRLTRDSRKKNLIPLCASHHIRIEKMTAPLHESFKDNYEEELALLNAVLRPRQAVTATVLMKEAHNIGIKN